VETTTNGVARLLLRPEEVAQALGIGRTTVFELMRSGELRSVKIGVSRRIPADAVAEYVAGLSA
jgi:excisionase family DNA binding protein